jgi:hypothetical protein
MPKGRALNEGDTKTIEETRRLRTLKGRTPRVMEFRSWWPTRGITAASCLAAPEASLRALRRAQSASFILTLSACRKRETCKGWQVQHCS